MKDRLVEPFLEQIAARRHPYFHALRSWGYHEVDLPLPDLEKFKNRRQVDRLIVADFSIVAEATGKPESFTSRHFNITGMLNNYLHSRTLSFYAQLLTESIENTAQRNLLKSTVGVHLSRAISGHRFGSFEQVGE